MADNQNTPGSHMNMFNKGMTRDSNESFVGDGLYFHARNAVNNSHDGQLGVIGNEPSTFDCVTLPYTLIGAIHLTDDRWAVFLTDDGDNSEIGIFDESDCSYTKVVNSKCLNFRTSHLITGESRRRYDCERAVYWDDGLNPTRFINMDSPPWIQNCTTENNCTTCVDTDILDCEKLRIAPLYKHPCVTIRKGNISGSLANGSYQACVAYTINQVRVTDYMSLTQIQGLFTHENTNSSLEIEVSNIDAGFDEFELVIIFNVNAQTVAKRIGFYDSSQGTIFIDRIDNTSVTVPLIEIILRGEPIEKTDATYSVNNYLLRVGVYSKFKFNYQPLANQIKTQWAAVEYPADYYAKGNNRTGYMRDEQYAFFIRFVYNTGEFSESYHIPGRPPGASDRDIITGGDDVTDGPKEKWQVYNTATVTDRSRYTIPGGGVVIAKGDMGFWESTEKYPSNRADIWNSNPGFPGDPLNLCGQKIRHHKMPDETVDSILSTFNSTGKNIVLLGVEFSNIQFPRDENGDPITSIVGYQILRGSREGNKSIIAKGLINNMMQYDIPTSGGVTRRGLYQNYPYNDLGQDDYLTTRNPTSRRGAGTSGTVDPPDPLTLGPRKDIFTFHSPETTFSNPFLSVDELTLYQQRKGKAYGSFVVPYKHPKFKVLSNGAAGVAIALGIIFAGRQLSSLLAGADVSVTLGATEDLPLSQQAQGQPFSAGWTVGLATGIAPEPISYALFLAGEALNIATGLTVMLPFLSLTADASKEQILNIIEGMIPKLQYAAQYVSQGFYSEYDLPLNNNKRRKILNINYVDDNIQQFTLDTNSSTAFTINNLNRGKTVALRVDRDVLNCTPLPGYSVGDDSRIILSDINDFALNNEYETRITSHYAGLKIQIPSQYGQLDTIRQLPISNCYPLISYNAGLGIPIDFPEITIERNGDVIIPDVPGIESGVSKNGTIYRVPYVLKTDVLFGGDIYINRFTEKNTMFFFSDWLTGQPDLFDYNYAAYPNVPFPRFWINNTKANTFFEFPSQYRCLDARDSATFYVKEGYFYLFNSGVRDFFVESEVNVAYRDWEDTVEKRHYDPNAFSDLTLIFRSDYIRVGNYYKYDYSLSVSKMFASNISWGSVLPKDYDPETYSTCYTYRPNRVIYSLQQAGESKKDNWRVFLLNNYRDFSSTVTSIKSVNKNGALFMMKFQSPLQFLGVDQLQTDTGTKITLGDGGLFNQAFQSLVNTDESYEYGSNQGRYCSVNTPNGLFWVSQNQGKVFQYAGSLNDITNNGMKWWFAKYLPSELLKVYPNYPLADNPVKGIGVQMIYDNTNQIIYITKKDYKPKNTELLYDENGFYYLGEETTTVLTCPPNYTLEGGTCVSNESACDVDYELVGNNCVKTETVPAIESSNVVNVTRTPFEVYGNAGTRVYTTASVSGSFTLLNPANPFWIRQPNPSNWNNLTPDQKQAFDLNNGPVNRLAVWGIQLSNGVPLNNYTVGFSQSSTLPPVGEWIGFDVCINITTSKTYYIAIAADNSYRFFLDDTLILSNTSGTVDTFVFLHIYPITISAGSHTLKLQGINDGQKAGFGCEVYDLDNRPPGTSVVDFLNAQTNYDNLDVIFTTRGVSQFSSNLYSCPAGFGLVNPTCDQPVCQRTITVPVENQTLPPTEVTTRNKIYCPFENSDCWEDASWTISYDPKIQAWISFHDWIPSFLIPGKTSFMSVAKGINNTSDTIWKHNLRCDSYCNFYGVDYPFEIGFTSTTGQQVNSMRNVEYLLEVYNNYNNCRDKFHVLDQNFDQAVIYNSEQVSGLLDLSLKSKTNPLDSLTYPQIGPTSIKIQFSKEENKYRFNQFWDITKDRGEFTNISLPMFVTEPNGYKFKINPDYVDYNKAVLQRKKFRHYVHNVFLKKHLSGKNKFLFKIVNEKLLQSPR